MSIEKKLIESLIEQSGKSATRGHELDKARQEIALRDASIADLKRAVANQLTTIENQLNQIKSTQIENNELERVAQQLLEAALLVNKQLRGARTPQRAALQGAIMRAQSVLIPF